MVEAMTAVRIRRSATRALAFLLLCGALFFAACIGRSQSYDTPLAAVEPAEVPDRARRWPLRIASYNAWILPWFSDELDERMEKMPAALVALSPDVLILQEVWSGGAREEISLAFGPAYVTARCDGGGLMVLSRYPILRERFTPFPFDWDLSLPEWFAKKGVMEVILETPAGPIRVVNAHLALAFGEDNGRTRQLRFLLDLLDERRDLPLVVGADLNTGTSHYQPCELNPEYEWVLDTGLRDLNPPIMITESYDHGPPTRVGWPRNPGRRGWRPDHLLVRDADTGRIRFGTFRLALDTPETALSDHNLLLGEITIEAP